MNPLETFGRWSANTREVVLLYLVVVLILVVPAIFSPAFRSGQNFTNIFNQLAPIGCVALGQTIVIVSQGIDLSVGGVMSLSTALAATYMVYGSPTSVLVAVGLILVAAAVVGLTNGVVIAKLGVDPLIATLATGSIVQGATLLVLPHPGGFVPRMFTDWWLYEIGGLVPASFLYFLASIGAGYFLLKHTRLGVRIYATGGNEDRARIAGIDVDTVKIKAYLLCSLFTSVSGMSLAVRMRSGDPLSGTPFTLLSIAAVVVGGTTFSGGRGGVLRTVAGVLILGVLSVILNIYGVSPYYQDVLTGVIIVIAVIYT